MSELHGTVYRHICSKNRHLHPYAIDPSAMSTLHLNIFFANLFDVINPAEDYDPEKDEFFTHDSAKVPQCPVEGCGSYLRPDAVLFMEGLPRHAWKTAERAVSGVRWLAKKKMHSRH